MTIQRRDFLAGAASAMILTGGARGRSAHAAAPESLGLSPVCDLHFDLIPPIRIPEGPHGSRTILRVAGGRVEGPRLNGRILEGGGDWAVMRADGIFEVDIRAALETDDGATIYTQYGGLVRMSPDNWKRFLSGDTPSDSEYYFRVTPRFETGDERYAWLNRSVFVGAGFDLPPTPKYRIFEVL